MARTSAFSKSSATRFFSSIVFNVNSPVSEARLVFGDKCRYQRGGVGTPFPVRPPSQEASFLALSVFLSASRKWWGSIGCDPLPEPANFPRLSIPPTAGLSRQLHLPSAPEVQPAPPGTSLTSSGWPVV